MHRQPIDDGGWFNRDAATPFDESDYFDGRNRISTATGSQWEHETLYLTRTGVYVLHHRSQWQGSHDTWMRVDAAAAADWLVRNGHEAPAGHPAIADAIRALEV